VGNGIISINKIKMKSATNKKCQFFPVCGGCSYLDLSDEEYFSIKKKSLQEVIKSDIEFDFFSAGPHSRRKIILQIDAKNNLGFFAKASKNLVEVHACYIAQKEISALIVPLKNFLKNFENNLITQITITLFDNSLDVIFNCVRELNFSQIKKITEFSQSFKINTSSRIKNEVTPILILQKNQIFYNNFQIDLDSDIFIQATKVGLQKITEIISDFILNKFTKKIQVADIYSGFGAYSFAIAQHVKEIYAYEGSEKMVKSIEKNALKNSLNAKIKAQHRDLIIYPISEKELEKFDLVIINPPRNGAGPQAFAIAKSKLKNLIYVSCNPQSFVRDAKILTDAGFKILKLTAIDQFYGTEHLELVAIFVR